MRSLGVGRVAGQLLQRTLTQRVSDEGCAVRREAGHRARAARARGGIGEVGRHTREHVVQLFPQVAFQLDDRGAPHRVDAAAAVQQIDLVRNLLMRRGEAGVQQLGDVTAQRLVARPGRDGAHQFE